MEGVADNESIPMRERGVGNSYEDSEGREDETAFTTDPLPDQTSVDYDNVGSETRENETTSVENISPEESKEVGKVESGESDFTPVGFVEAFGQGGLGNADESGTKMTSEDERLHEKLLEDLLIGAEEVLPGFGESFRDLYSRGEEIAGDTKAKLESWMASARDRLSKQFKSDADNGTVGGVKVGWSRHTPSENRAISSKIIAALHPTGVETVESLQATMGVIETLYRNADAFSDAASGNLLFYSRSGIEGDIEGAARLNEEAVDEKRVIWDALDAVRGRLGDLLEEDSQPLAPEGDPTSDPISGPTSDPISYTDRLRQARIRFWRWLWGDDSELGDSPPMFRADVEYRYIADRLAALRDRFRTRPMDVVDESIADVGSRGARLKRWIERNKLGLGGLAVSVITGIVGLILTIKYNSGKSAEAIERMSDEVDRIAGDVEAKGALGKLMAPVLKAVSSILKVLSMIVTFLSVNLWVVPVSLAFMFYYI